MKIMVSKLEKAGALTMHFYTADHPFNKYTPKIPFT